MDTQSFIEKLRSLEPNSLSWSFALYSTHRTKDGVELEWYLCRMEGTAGWIETVKTGLLEKTAVEKTVAEYSPFLSDKESIAAIEKNNSIIKDRISDIIISIRNGLTYSPEDFISGVLPKVTGYGFYGVRKEEDGTVGEEVVVMRRGNPFLTGQKVRLCTSNGDTIITNSKPLLKFTPVIDFIMLGEVCYFNSSAIEKDFALENRYLAIAAKRMGIISELGIVSDYEKLEGTVMSVKNARKFGDFNKELLEYIAQMGIVEREEFLSVYGIVLDNEGRMDTSDSEQCELVIDLLCCRSVIDPLGRLSTGNNIIPR